MFPKDSSFEQERRARERREEYIGVDPLPLPPVVAAQQLDQRTLEEWYATLSHVANEMSDSPQRDTLERVRDDIYRHLY